MTAFTKLNTFVEDLGTGVHDFSSNTIKVALTNTSPVATDSTLSDITEIAAGNGYTAGGITLTNVTYSQTSGLATLDADNFSLTASGGSIGPFQYLVLYNDTATNDPLVAFWEEASAITLTDGQEYSFNVNASGILTVV